MTINKGKRPQRARVRKIEQYVAEQMREFRIEQGLTQEAMAKEIGVTFQQYQKYEKGDNRISVGKLYYISNALHLSINAFFPVEKFGDYAPTPAKMRRVMQLCQQVAHGHYEELITVLLTLVKITGGKTDK